MLCAHAVMCALLVKVPDVGCEASIQLMVSKQVESAKRTWLTSVANIPHQSDLRMVGDDIRETLAASGGRHLGSGARDVPAAFGRQGLWRQ